MVPSGKARPGLLLSSTLPKMSLALVQGMVITMRWLLGGRHCPFSIHGACWTPPSCLDMVLMCYIPWPFWSNGLLFSIFFFVFRFWGFFQLIPMSCNKTLSTRDKGEGQAATLGGRRSLPLPFSVVYQICSAGESRKKIFKKNHPGAEQGGKARFYLFWFFGHFQISEGEPKSASSILTSVA